MASLTQPLNTRTPTVISQPAILYVEDEKSDVLLLRVALTRARLTNPVHIVVDGAEAIDYLAGNGPFADRTQHPLPALVLLDLNLPKKSGFEVLSWVRQQPQFSSLPVVIYTSSVGLIDKDTARLFGATDYFVKRSGVNQIAELARSLTERWLPHSASS
jgi:CheY-like chemotaxis protein